MLRTVGIACVVVLCLCQGSWAVVTASWPPAGQDAWVLHMGNQAPATTPVGYGQTFAGQFEGVVGQASNTSGLIGTQTAVQLVGVAGYQQVAANPMGVYQGQGMTVGAGQFLSNQGIGGGTGQQVVDVGQIQSLTTPAGTTQQLSSVALFQAGAVVGAGSGTAMQGAFVQTSQTQVQH